MRRTTTCCARQLLSSAPFRPTIETSRIPLQYLRPFSTTTISRADNDNTGFSSTATEIALRQYDIQSKQLAARQKDGVRELRTLFSNIKTKKTSQLPAVRAYNPAAALSLDYSREMGIAPGIAPLSQDMKNIIPDEGIEHSEEPHHFHIMSSKHNCHITLTSPDRNPLISVSCGNIGFRHSGRGQYDSAYQLAGYVINQMTEKGIIPERLEVVLRGFGPGREAVTKALLGAEGKFLRDKIVRVADATRLKFGGTRSPNPRRLG